MLTANFTKGRKSGADILDIARITNGQRTDLESYEVLGKREARKVAQSLGATPWNF
jgi:hypothetical protein